MLKRSRLIIKGRVQGIGFRPAIYRIAVEYGLAGFVQNSTTGVTIEIEGHEKKVDDFINNFGNHLPKLSVIDEILTEVIELKSDSFFSINPSKRSGELLAGMPPDLALCKQCQEELDDPKNHRYQYPFINCTDCGPRYSIIQKLPYDREYTSMKYFEMCQKCKAEYIDPANRRFDAQPNACPDCGPGIELIDADSKTITCSNPVQKSIELLNQGKILALKGLGGYHIACDAKNRNTIAILRDRKSRPHKSLAVMFSTIEEIELLCHVSPSEKHFLISPAAPIVILGFKKNASLPDNISPDTETIGVFLPYTPLHHLLLKQISPLIMTSANQSDEPIIIDEKGLPSILGSVADYALVHNRQILRRCDDSVIAFSENNPLFIRRSRGYVPESIPLSISSPSVLACGGDLKNTFSLSKASRIYLSQYIGDLQYQESRNFYQEQIIDLKNLLSINPEIIACDKHPEYYSTQFALQNIHSCKIFSIQHHHAHISSCMLEHQLKDPVIGIAFDGTGFGDDGNIWGGEFMVSDLTKYERYFHFNYVPMPGAEAAINNPQHMALSFLLHSFPPEKALDLSSQFLSGLGPNKTSFLSEMIEKKFRSPLTSSAGRLFDAVAALLGFTEPVTYEGQAAIRLENMAFKAPTISTYDFDFSDSVISTKSIISGIVFDLKHGISPNEIAAKFHCTLTKIISVACQKISSRTGIKSIVLSGGVFQNRLLLESCTKNLSNLGYIVYSHHIIPPSDSGLSAGQAAIAAALFAKEH